LIFLIHPWRLQSLVAAIIASCNLLLFILFVVVFIPMNGYYMTIFKYLVAAILLLGNPKCLPFSWTIRFYYMVVRYMVIPSLLQAKREKKKLPPPGQPSKAAANELSSSVAAAETSVPASITEKDELKLFRSSNWTSFANFLEIDANLHKSNSTYFTDLDLARTKLLLPLFRDFFVEHRLETGRFPYVPLGSVMAVFRREIGPLQRYVVRSRVLGWDNKWLFVLSRFEIGSGSTSDKANARLAAVALSKYVFKDGRKTIAPEDAIHRANLDLTPAVLQRGRMDFDHAKSFLQSEGAVDLPMY
jgi:hypothetical protein